MVDSEISELERTSAEGRTSVIDPTTESDTTPPDVETGTSVVSGLADLDDLRRDLERVAEGVSASCSLASEVATPVPSNVEEANEENEAAEGDLSCSRSVKERGSEGAIAIPEARLRARSFAGLWRRG